MRGGPLALLMALAVLMAPTAFLPAASACSSCTAYAVSVTAACDDACPVLEHGTEATLPLHVEVAWEVTGSPLLVEGNPDASKDVLVELAASGHLWIMALPAVPSFWFSPLRDGEPQPGSTGVPVGEVARWSHTRQVDLTLVPDFSLLAHDNATLDLFVRTHVHVPDNALGSFDTLNVTAIPMAWDPASLPLRTDAAPAQAMPAAPVVLAGLGILAFAWRGRGPRRARPRKS